MLIVKQEFLNFSRKLIRNVSPLELTLPPNISILIYVC